MVLVSRLWREVGEAPGLWAWVKLRLTRENIDRMWEVVGSRRMGGVQVVKVQEYLPAQHLWQLEPIFTAVWGGVTSIKKLHISNINLSSLDPALLACAVGRLEEVWLNETQLTPRQAEMVINALCWERFKIKDTRHFLQCLVCS